MKNKPLLFAVIYSLAFIAALCIAFYGHYEKFLMMIYVLGMAAILPFTVLTIKVQRDTVYQGVISGKDAAKEGMRFVFFSFLILLAFQLFFFYSGFRDYKMDYLINGEFSYLRHETETGKLKMTPAEMQRQAHAIAVKASMVNIQSEIFGVFIRTILVGLFSSFVSALFLKKREA